MRHIWPSYLTESVICDDSYLFPIHADLPYFIILFNNIIVLYNFEF